MGKPFIYIVNLIWKEIIEFLVLINLNDQGVNPKLTDLGLSDKKRCSTNKETNAVLMKKGQECTAFSIFFFFVI